MIAFVGTVFLRNHSELKYLIGKVCNKQIVTFGQCPTSTCRHAVVCGFVNEPHIDTTDVLSKNQVESFKCIISPSSHYERRWVESTNSCIYTTCGYQFVPKYPSKGRSFVRPTQYFSLEGLGLAMNIQHGIAHNFLAAMFVHSTTLATKTYLDGSITSGNNDDDCQVFAWGVVVVENNWTFMNPTLVFKLFLRVVIFTTFPKGTTGSTWAI